MSEVKQVLLIKSYAAALLVEARLTEEGIPYHMQPFNDPAFGSFWRRREGWGVLLAPAEHGARIREICVGLSDVVPSSLGSQ